MKRLITAFLVLGLNACAHDDLQPEQEPDVIDVPSESEASETNAFAAHFKFDSVALTSADKDQIKQLIKSERKEETKVEVHGYADATGPAAYNQALSERRAASVKAYLMTLGIREHNITVVGHGENHPGYANDSKENRARNRRAVTVYIRK
jgi:outer membrane protein OmpA-like peptidoglycan-associated protein